MMYQTPMRCMIFLTIVMLSACGGSSDDDSESNADASSVTDDGSDASIEDGDTDDNVADVSDTDGEGTTDDTTDIDGADDGVVVIVDSEDEVANSGDLSDDGVVGDGTEDDDIGGGMDEDIIGDEGMPDDNTDVIDSEAEDIDNGSIIDETELETLSRVADLGIYTGLIEVVSSLEANPEFTDDNFQDALDVIGEASQSSLVFQRARFLTLLETQIQEGTSTLDFLNITEGNANRVHICPDGGRLLSRKADLTAVDDLSGVYTFEECSIGDIFINGSYASTETLFNTPRLFRSFDFSRLRMIGIDNVETVLDDVYQHNISVSDNNTGGEILTTTTTDLTDVSIGIDDVGVLDISRSITNVETAEDASVDVEVPLIAAGRVVALRSVAMSVQDDLNVTLRASITTDYAESAEGSTFEQGEMQLTLNGAPNRLRLQAANGDPATYDVFILQEDNSVVSFNVSWSISDLDFGSLERLPELTLAQ